MRIMKKVVALSLCTALVFTSDLGLSTSKAVELDETTEVVTEESVGTDMYEIDETEDFDSDISVQLDDIDVEDTEVSDDMEDVYDEDIEVIEQIDETADIQDIIEEDNIYGSTYMDEAVPLSFNTTVSYKFDKGISQRRVYKITASKDAIISWKGKAYADSDDTDKITINLYNEDGEELIDKTCYIYTNEGFESFEGYYCVTKGNYYLMFSNCDNYSLGEYFSYIGTDSISFTANLEYPSSTEKENNDNFNKAQTITGDSMQYGVIPYNDEYDTYKINVDYSGEFEIDFEGYNLGTETHYYYINLYDINGKEIKSKTAYYSDNEGCSSALLETELDPGTYYIQIQSYYQGYYYFYTHVPGKYKSNGYVYSSGIYCLQESPTIVAGLVTEKSNYSDSVEYEWYACNEKNPNKWFKISSWTTDNEWVTWTPSESGNYILLCKARVLGNEEASEISKSIGITNHKYIKDKCQMPYSGGGYLIGFESFDNPNQGYQYQMLIMDLTLYAQGLPCWVHDTGKIRVSEGSALWTLWQPKYGYYLTYFKLYDAKGNVIDEVCYGFQNAY